MYRFGVDYLGGTFYHSSPLFMTKLSTNLAVSIDLVQQKETRTNLEPCQTPISENMASPEALMLLSIWIYEDWLSDTIANRSSWERI